MKIPKIYNISSASLIPKISQFSIDEQRITKYIKKSKPLKVNRVVVQKKIFYIISYKRRILFFQIIIFDFHIILHMTDYFQVAQLSPWWPKLELKILPHLAQSLESELMDGF